MTHAAGRLGVIVSGAVRVVAVAVVVFLAPIYLKLGYFILLLLPLGAIIAVLLTRRQRAGYSPVWSSLVAGAAYLAAYALIWSAAIQNRDETRQLEWEVIEHPRHGPEVRVYLGGGHFLYSGSSELASHLRSRSDKTVTVTLSVNIILGCYMSAGNARIEGWGVMPVSGHGFGAGDRPRGDHWWCP